MRHDDPLTAMTAFCLAAARPRCKRRPCLCGTDCGARFRCLGLAQAPAAAGEGMKEAPVNSPFSWSTNYRHPAEWDQIFAPLSLPDMLAASVARKGDAPMLDFMRSEEHTSELQSLMSISYAGLCLKNK